MPLYTLKLNSSDSILGRFSHASIDYFTVFDDLHDRLTAPRTARTLPPIIIDRPLIIIAHGVQTSAAFNVNSIYTKWPGGIPKAGSTVFTAYSKHFLLSSSVHGLRYLTRRLTPHLGIRNKLYLNTFYPFNENTPEHILSHDYGKAWITTELFRQTQLMLSEIQKKPLFSSYIPTGGVAPDIERFAMYTTTQTLCDVIFVKEGTITLSHLLRSLHDIFGIMSQHIRITCCRGSKKGDPIFELTGENEILRECIEFGLPTQYVIQIITIIKFIRDKHIAERVNHYFADEPSAGIAVPALPLLEESNLIPDALFYITRYFYMIHHKIVPGFDARFNENIKDSALKLGDYYFDLFIHNFLSHPPTAIVLTADTTKLYFQYFTTGVIFCLFGHTGHIGELIWSSKLKMILDEIRERTRNEPAIGAHTMQIKLCKIVSDYMMILRQDALGFFLW